MNNMMMMAMAIGMSHKSNATSTVQTILGASDNLGQTGRLAVGMIRQRSDEQDREASDRRLGKEVLALLEANRLGPQVLEKYPGLARVVALATPTAATTTKAAANVAPAHAHGTPAPAAASPPAQHSQAQGLGAMPLHGQVDDKFVMAVRAGNVAGLDRLARSADVAAQEATAEAAVAAAAAVAAETTAKADADACDAAQKEADKNPGKADVLAAAVAAKKKAGETAAAAERARSDAHRAEATAHAMRHAAKDLKIRLAAEC
jgi:hypothetical protein